MRAAPALAAGARQQRCCCQRQRQSSEAVQGHHARARSAQRSRPPFCRPGAFGRPGRASLSLLDENLAPPSHRGHLKLTAAAEPQAVQPPVNWRCYWSLALPAEAPLEHNFRSPRIRELLLDNDGIALEYQSVPTGKCTYY